MTLWKSRTRFLERELPFLLCCSSFHFLSGLQKHVSQNLYLAHTTYLFYISRSFFFISFSYKDSEWGKNNVRLSEKQNKTKNINHSRVDTESMKI